MNDLYIRGVRIRKDEIENFNEYPFNIPIINSLESLEFNSRVTFLVGENGTGKSTLIEAIATCFGFNPEGGSKNFRFSTNDTHSDLYRYLTISKGIRRPKDGFFLRAESFYNVSTEIDTLNDVVPSTFLASYGGKSLHDQSHGESFLSLVMNRFFGKGLYILDEPEAALSPTRQMSLLVKIHDLVKDDSQFIIATHSPILLAYPDSEIYVLNDNKLVRTRYEETEHYIITKQFLNNTGKMLKELLR